MFGRSNKYIAGLIDALRDEKHGNAVQREHRPRVTINRQNQIAISRTIHWIIFNV